MGGGVGGEGVEAGRQSVVGVGRSLGEGVDDAQEDFAGGGALFGLGAEGDLAGDHQRPQVALGVVVVGRDGRVARPAVQPVGFLAEEVLHGLARPGVGPGR